MKKIQSAFYLVSLLTIFIYSTYPTTSLAQNYTPSYNLSDDGENSLKSYFNVGIGGDFALRGYESALVERDTRLVYTLELGIPYFAIPLSYSYGQDVHIFGLKPRFQYLVNLGAPWMMMGPGVGAVLNYWHSSFDIATIKTSTNVFEVGVQPSFHILLRPAKALHILISPASFDFNFYRRLELSAGARGQGNFSTTNRKLGIVYTGSAAVGFNF